TSFKLRYNNSLLGFLWVLLKPFMLFLIMFFVWSRLLENTQENYALYLLLGIMMFTFFSEGVTMGMNALLEKAHIILKVNFPRQIVLLSSTLMAVINLCINLGIFLIFSIFNGGSNAQLGTVLYGVWVFLVFYLFILGVSFFTSIFLIYLRDLSNVTDVGLQLLFWSTPIFYSLDTSIGGRSYDLSGIVKQLIGANPLGIVIDTVRAAFIAGEVRNWELMLAYFVVTLFLCLVGWKYFSDKVRRIAESF
ncbi:MAG: ABC transporter permease, partial [Candidatus Jettenia sp.]|nr:ABC transporter permease [Candidatus Jettenia sp.]